MELEKASFPLPGQWNGGSPPLFMYPWEGQHPSVTAAGTGFQESLVMDALRLAGGISSIMQSRSMPRLEFQPFAQSPTAPSTIHSWAQRQGAANGSTCSSPCITGNQVPYRKVAKDRLKSQPPLTACVIPRCKDRMIMWQNGNIVGSPQGKHVVYHGVIRSPWLGKNTISKHHART